MKKRNHISKNEEIKQIKRKSKTKSKWRKQKKEEIKIKRREKEKRVSSQRKRSKNGRRNLYKERCRKERNEKE